MVAHACRLEAIRTHNTVFYRESGQFKTTYRDDQVELALHVVEGESRLTAENRTVGRFKISGLPPGPAGSIEIEVVFEMNESGALNITARNLATGERTKSRFELEG